MRHNALSAVRHQIFFLLQKHPKIISLAISCSIGFLTGLLCISALTQTNQQAGDFGWAIRAANDILAGKDIYQHPFGNDLVPYPLPAAFFALPLVMFSPSIAAGIFFGISSALLAWCILQTQNKWLLLLFFSWPFAYSLLFVQWTPLIFCMAFLSPLLPLLLVKPQSVIPLLVLHPFSRQGIILLLLTGIVSLIIYPTWPFVWLGQISGYKGSTPPILSLPFGPILLLALFQYRKRKTWFFLLLAFMPQRVLYDQLALFLVARSRGEAVFLAICSWITLPALLIFDGWLGLPGGWQNWIVLTLYVPTLIILLRQRES
jgi:hypothetical protein